MNRDDLQSQIAVHNRRLQKLKLQQAQQGINTDPAILIEIEDLEATIASLQAQIDATSDLAAKDPPQPLTAFQQRRLADLQRHVEQDYQLLKEYEDLLRAKDDPRRLMRYRGEIERQKAALAGYEAQLAELIPSSQITAQPEAVPVQEMLTALQNQISTLEKRLLAGQQGLSDQLRQQEHTLLNRIDARHRETLERVTAQLEAGQLETVNLLYDVVDQGQMAQWELDEITTLVQQSLAKLKDAPNAAYWRELMAEASKTSAVDQKLKLMLPLIPGLLGYELELRADPLPALQKVWQRLISKVKR
jgi:hypothetical protein